MCDTDPAQDPVGVDKEMQGKIRETTSLLEDTDEANQNLGSNFDIPRHILVLSLASEWSIRST
jgi:hypothetical protein